MFGFFPRNVSDRPFDPLQASPYAAWDALLRPDLITVGGGNAVSSWRDIVAGYDLTQATGAAQPIYSATGFNGSPVVTGDGVDDELTLTGVPVGIPTGATPVEMWWVVDQQTPTSNATTLTIGGYGGSTDSTTRQLRRVVGSGPVNRPRYRDSGTGDLAGITIDFTNRWVVRNVSTGTQLTMQAGGITSTGARVSTIGTDRIRLFANPVAALAANFWAGGISALWIMPLLTPYQAAQMFAYLNARV